MKVFIKRAHRNGVDGWEVTYAGMTRFTPNEWQAKIYYHQVIQSYGFKELYDEPTSHPVDN
jgi:hypothetical protein